MSKIKVVCPHCGQVNAIPLKEHYSKADCGHCKSSLLETKPVTFDTHTFDNHVANNEIVVIADFWATWCGPCQMMAPVFEQVAVQFPLKARFGKVNTEEQRSLSARFGIQSIPTIIAFQGNREVDRVSGALSADQLHQWVQKFI